MNDKQQLAAMGEHMSEQAAQPLCMAKRIEELEAQVRVMSELLRDLHKHIGTSIPQTVSEHYRGCDLLDRIDAALAGKLPEPVMQEGWKLVPMKPTERMISESIDAGRFDEDDAVFFWASMIAAAPKPETK